MLCFAKLCISGWLDRIKLYFASQSFLGLDTLLEPCFASESKAFEDYHTVILRFAKLFNKDSIQYC